MLMKTIIINAGPRKNQNTAMMLKEAQKGAEAAGAETEYIDLFDLNFTGCRSCLTCKRKGAQRNKCYWKDDCSPLIDKILKADALIIGSPIYLGEPTARFRALFERLIFCVLSYDDYKGYFDGKVNVGIIYTMNAPQSYFESAMKPVSEAIEGSFRNFLRGTVKTVCAFSTLQVADYSLYSMAKFNEAERRERRETQFPLDLKEAYQLGEELSRG